MKGLDVMEIKLKSCPFCGGTDVHSTTFVSTREVSEKEANGNE